MERKAWRTAVLAGLLTLAGAALSAEAGAVEGRAGLGPTVKPALGVHLGGIAGEVWNWLLRVVGANRSTIDPNGQPSPGEGTDNLSTIDPDGQPAPGASLDNHGTIDPNG